MHATKCTASKIGFASSRPDYAICTQTRRASRLVAANGQRKGWNLANRVRIIRCCADLAATPAPIQRGDGELPRGRRETYTRFLRRIQDLSYEQIFQREQYEKYGKRWDDQRRDKASEGEPARGTYRRLLAIDAELSRRAEIFSTCHIWSLTQKKDRRH